MGPLLNRTGDLEKVEVLNAIFASVFLSRTHLWDTQVLETRKKSWSKIKEHQIREYLSKMDLFQSMDLWGVLTSVDCAGRCHCGATFINL